MSDSVIFDTHACVKRMTKAGVEPHVAEAFATEQVNILEHNIATKSDIEALRLATKTDIEGLRKDTTTAIEGLRKDTTTAIEGLRKDTQITIAQLETKLIRWVVGTGATFFGLALAAFKFL